MYAEIESLPRFAGMHRKVRGYYRLFTATFTFSIYYSVQNGTILVKAVLDNRRLPAWIKSNTLVKPRATSDWTSQLPHGHSAKPAASMASPPPTSPCS